jgi:hypothetical protein
MGLSCGGHVRTACPPVRSRHVLPSMRPLLLSAMLVLRDACARSRVSMHRTLLLAAPAVFLGCTAQGAGPAAACVRRVAVCPLPCPPPRGHGMLRMRKGGVHGLLPSLPSAVGALLSGAVDCGCSCIPHQPFTNVLFRFACLGFSTLLSPSTFPLPSSSVQRHVPLLSAVRCFNDLLGLLIVA